MLIGIDASRAYLKDRTGIEEYSFQVIENLKNDLKEHEVVLYLRKGQDKLIEKLGLSMPENWKLKVIKLPFLWTQVGLSLEMLRNPVDVLFIPAHTVPFIHPENTVVVVHGLEYEFCPGAYSFWERLYMGFSIRNSCRWAKRIIAVSENTRRDLGNLYEVPDEKVSVIYEGVSEDLLDNDYDDTSSSLNPYLLFIGRIEERKNVGGIIKAFEILKESHSIPHKLMLAGKPGYGYEAIREQMENSRHKGDIIELGFVGKEEKKDLYRNADVFLFPSFYEGFGLPVLEAQGVGAAVVASDASSLPEVAGEGALLVDPESPEEIAKGVWKIISDDNFRSGIIKKGVENTKRFSWKKCASEIAQVLNKK